MLEKRRAVEIHWHHWRVSIVTDGPVTLDMLNEANRICNHDEPEVFKAINTAIDAGTISTNETFVMVDR